MDENYEYVITKKPVEFSNMYYGAPRILFEFAKKLRNEPTEAEDFLWKQLSNNKLGVRFKRQHPILYFIADFYCHSAKLIIEVDGGYHNIPFQYEYDCNRDFELEELGLKVLRFSNEQIFQDIEMTIQHIEKEVKLRVKYYESKTKPVKSPLGDLGV